MTTCGKVRFTQAAAETALTDAKIAAALHGSQKRRERRTYQCPACSFWHLTSTDAR